MRRPSVLFCVIFLLGVAADRWVKWREMAEMTVGQSIEVIPYILNFTYVRNTGVGFGLFAGVTWLPITVTVIVLGSVAYAWYRLRPMPTLLAIAMALLSAGAVGNLIDRLSYGYVVDLFDLAFIDFPVFNVADLMVNIGCGMIIIWLLFKSGAYFEEHQ